MNMPALKSVFYVMVLSILLVLSGSMAYAETITDNFDDNLLDTSLWAPYIVGNGTVNEIDGILEATVVSSTDPYTLNVAGIQIRGTVVGDFDVIVDYELLDPLPLTDGEPGALIFLGADFSDLMFIGRAVNNDTILDQYVASIDSEVGVPTSDMYGKLRFTRVGTSYSAYYWDSDWHLVDTALGPDDPFPYLFIGVVNEGPGTVHATFDNFSLEADNFIPITKSYIIVDFGSGPGLWARYTDTSWLKLHNLSPEIIATGDLDSNGIDECIIDFGSGIGIYILYNNTTWTKLHGLSSEIIATGDLDGNGQDDCIIDFGSGTGVWIRYNNTTWTKLHSLSPEIITTGDLDGSGKDDCIIDFGSGIGIYVYYNNTTWMKLHSASAELIGIGDGDGNDKDDCLIDFGPGVGVWIWYNNQGWEKLHSLSPEIIAGGDLDGNGATDGIFDFGPGTGIWVLYNSTTWTKLHNLSPEIIETGDLDSNGKDDVIIDFGPGIGIYVRYNNSTWTKLHSLSPESITTGNMDDN